ncbi:hypothetical protein [Bacillus cereus]|uniref:hypothetical protein n=1 Tax=Bacillus cereus TaxID=1396 RepID=UPI003814D0D4
MIDKRYLTIQVNNDRFLKSSIMCWEFGKLADTRHSPYLNDGKYEYIHLEEIFLNLHCRTEIHSFLLLQRNR